jgi:Family of unknown function (DUF6518)
MRRTLAVLAAGALFGVAIRLTWSVPEAQWVSRVAWPWLLAAFAVGVTARDVRRAAVDGAVLLSAATVAYYAVLALAEGHYDYSPVGVWWVLVAIPAGALAGAAGRAVRAGPPSRRVAAASLFAVLVAAEAFGTTAAVTHTLHDLRSTAY